MPPDDADADLVRRYATARDHDAFARLVARHVDLVYAAALRQLRDPGRAEDVTQQVFIALARKATRLRPGTILAAWLLTATRLAAAQTLRGESRRLRHERAAARAATRVIRDRSDAGAEDRGDQIARVLDDALAELSDRLRTAIVLRYLQGHDVAEVARRLDITPDAAKQRMSRGVEQLRGLLARRGIGVTAVALAAGLSAPPAAGAAPPHLAAAAAAAAAHSSVTPALLKGALMASAQSKVTAATIAVALITLTGAIAYYRHVPAAPAGQAPPTGGNPVAPAPGPQMTGVVRTPDGQPAAGVEVVLGTPDAPVAAYSPPSPLALARVTAADGVFAFPRPAGLAVIVARGPLGYATAAPAELAATPDLVLRPWSHVDGVLLVAGQPAAGHTVCLRRFDAYHDPGATLARHDRFAATDAAGRFRFQHVAPGLFILSLRLDNPYRHTHETFVELKPGDTARPTVGGGGTTVTGVVSFPLPPSGRYVVAGVLWPRTDVEVPRPDDWNDLTPPQRERWAADWHKTPQGQAHYRQNHGHAFDVGADGAYEAHDIPPGKYRLRIACRLEQAGQPNTEELAAEERDVEVPATGAAPLNVRTIELRPALR